MTALGRKPLLALGFGAALLAGCAAGPPERGADPDVAPGLVRSFPFTLGGKTYTVHRLSGRENLFQVRTADGGPGDRRAMRRAVLLAYDCHALALRETEPDWRAAEASGALCTGGYQRFSPSR